MQEQADQHWATVTRLPVAEVRALRIAAGILDGSDRRIESLDTSMLDSRKHILLFDRGVFSSCLVVHVLQQNTGDYSQVWSLSQVPTGIGNSEVSGTGGPICMQGPRAPSVHTTTDALIVVEIPVYNYPFQRSVPMAAYRYRWDGHTYNLIEE